MPHTYDYPRPALTADIALVTRDDAPTILLIRRKKDPFAGQWALPGGFVDEGETIIAAARRELGEETGLTDQVDLEQLRTFGDPGRDPRGWTVSVVFLGRVPGSGLQATAADDAEEAEWWPLNGLPSPLAFDHDEILSVVRERLR
jgi:8-oxo-dGTP diphosphatase